MMNKKEIEIGKRSFAIIEKCKDDLLKLCDGQPISLTLAVLTTCADSLTETANEIRDLAGGRKDAWDLLNEAWDLIHADLEETLK